MREGGSVRAFAVGGNTASGRAEPGIGSGGCERRVAVFARSGADCLLFGNAFQAPLVSAGVDPISLKRLVLLGLSALRAPAVLAEFRLVAVAAAQRAVALDAGTANVMRLAADGAVEREDVLPDRDGLDLWV